MSDFFEIFNPGQRYTRQQLETEKLLVVQDAQGGSGPDPLDLDSGSVVLRMPASAVPEPDEGAGTVPFLAPESQPGAEKGTVPFLAPEAPPEPGLPGAGAAQDAGAD